MKHVKSYQICKAIVKPFDEYVQDVEDAFGTTEMDVGLDGSIDGLMPTEELAKFYDVPEITSIHADGTEYNTIWIAYRE